MATPPQDLFDEVDPVPTQPPQRAVQGKGAGAPTPEVRGVAPQRSRWPLLAGGVIVMLVGIGVVVVLMRREPAPSSANTNTQNLNAAANVAAETNTATNRVSIPEDAVSNDKDRDGLTDEEEQKLGINTAIADTDGDNLSDYDEVRVYKTNPLKPDTDGDGNADGAEVKKGYNPNGSGTLLDFEAARQKLTP